MTEEWGVKDLMNEEIACSACGKSTVLTRAFVADGVTAYATDDLPHGWLVFSTYPPGDTGQGFACSASCFLDWAGVRRDR